MLWIEKFTEFCKNIGGPASGDMGTHCVHEPERADESNQVWSFEPEAAAVPARTLTAKEHGDRLLQRTKEKALRRLWAKEHDSAYVH